ncbi:RNA-binding protein RO60-like [Mytilus californianus]|uniref:RNA-binding protein RO60-like n=1 Tax=Mytilus californianus TaxID=6549 RepID=UPI002246E399|nr:RNA-binding protein RO60-like [Mytilus californianus]
MACQNNEISDSQRLQRFLVYGRDDGRYFVNERQSNVVRDFSQHSRIIDRMISKGEGREVVDLIKEVSIDGRAPKQCQLLYALAVCARCNDRPTKDAALRCLDDICRTPTHLFQFIKFTSTQREGSRGWGRAQRKAVSEWYNQAAFRNNPKKLLRLGTKYKKRHGYTHRDLIRLAHVKPTTHHIKFVIQYIVKGMSNSVNSDDSDGMIMDAKQYIYAVEQAKKCSNNDIRHLVPLIKRYKLTREHIPTNLLNFPDVWRALMYEMPMHALIRNLGRISKHALLHPDSPEEQHILDNLLDEEKLRSARIHPLTILTAWNSYKLGRSIRNESPMQWNVNETVADALETAFYKSFSSCVATGKKVLIAIDGSEEMMNPVVDLQEVSARSAAVSVALLMSKVESWTEFVLVSDSVSPVDVLPNDNLETASFKFSTSECACLSDDASNPITWAMSNSKQYDAIVYFTACTSNGGNNAKEAMTQYRSRLGLPSTRLVVVAMTSNNNTITDPNDIHMLNVVGFDTKAMKVITEFIR